MLWFTIHNFLKNFTSMENQNRNLTTFLTGTVLYVLFYSYAGSFDFNSNLFFKRIFGFFIYIIIADGFAMAILYKNFYKQTIFTEVQETLGSSGPKMTAANVEPITTVEANLSDDENTNAPLLNNNSDYIDEQEGFTKDSALGDAYNTNGNSNI
jgi:hypothetical protein